MPSSINVNGSTKYVPGVYGTIDASALGGKGLVIGRVGVAGAFPMLQSDTPTRFSSARKLAALDPTNKDLARIARLLFSPSLDDAVPGGASDVTLVNVQTNTQAGYTFKDSAAADSLKVSSRLWGPRGNAVLATMEQNASDGQLVDVTLSRDGVTETLTGLGSGNLASLYYNGDDLTACTLTIDPTQLKWLWSILSTALPTGAGNKVTHAMTGDVIVNSTVLSTTLTVVTPVGKVTTVKFTGKNELGVDTVETVTFAAGEGAVAKLTTGSWSEITEIETESDDVAYIGQSTVTGTSFDLVPSAYAKLTDLLAAVNFPSKGYNATSMSPLAGQAPADELDKQTTIDCYAKAPATAKVTARADLWKIAAQITAKSEIATAARTTGATLPPKHVGGAAVKESVLLAGGAASAVGIADWTGAFAQLQSLDIQIVVPFDETATVHAEAVTHCRLSALAGFERNAWCGAIADQTIAQLYATYSGVLNTRNTPLVGARIRVVDAAGNLEWLSPKYFALQCAGMQAGTTVGTPLTNKRPNVYAFDQNWSTGEDDDEVISKGICALTSDALGVKVLRSVTTYLTDDNPFFSEVSANESLNTSIRSLRGALVSKIGNPSTTLSPARLQATVEAQLDKQVTDAIIKAYQNVVIEDLGDTYNINYEAAPVEPLNFMRIGLSAVRITA